MRFAKWVFLLAGASGVLLIVPLYFLEKRLGEDYPPPINHPEYFYGFLNVALVWQMVYFVIGADPVRFRPLMLLGALGKASVFVTLFVLYAMQRVVGTSVAVSMFDLVWSLIFVIAFLRTPQEKSS
jgi:hypothetical protein